MPQRVRDSAARVRRHAEIREPRRELALHAMLEFVFVVAMRLQRGQQMRVQQRDRLACERVGNQMMARRVRTLDRVIERAHPGRGPQPCRRLDCQRGIADDRPGLQARVGNYTFHFGGFVGDAAPRRELARRQRGRYRDMQNLAAAARRCSRAGEIYRARAGAGRSIRAQCG